MIRCLSHRLFLALLSGLTLATSAAASRVVIGDAQLKLTILYGDGVFAETQVQVETERLGLSCGYPWRAKIGGAWLGPAGAKLQSPLAGSRLKETLREAVFTGQSGPLEWRLKYAVQGAGRIVKSLSFVPEKAVRLERLALWSISSKGPPVVARTGLTDIVAFYRQGKFGLFASLDFPFSQIAREVDLNSVAYPPFADLAAGTSYASHTLTIGATRLSGRMRFGYDEGEIAAMDAYVQEHCPPRFERPMVVSTSINNRFTQPAGDVVFYTRADHPALNFNTDLLKRELALMPRLGVEYYQVFPGVFDWTPTDPDPAIVRELAEFARRQGVRIGDYSGCNGLFCPHYNEHRNRLARPEWQMLDREGRRGNFCFGDPAFVDYYIQTVVPTARRFGFEMHTLDFLGIRPCYDKSHGHPPGPDGVYHQVLGLVRLLEAINAVAPQMMTWSNSGNWVDLLPKIAWSNSNLYLTDPFISTPWQGLNMTRLLDDARREQMVSLHDSRFIPYRFLTNFQYFFSQNSIVPDIRNYQYGALSTLAVTPNLGLGEIRPWLDRLPEKRRREVIDFYKQWTDFVRANFDLWKQTYRAGSDPGMGGVEIYCHAQGNHGFIFVVNPNYWDATVELPLDARLGFAASGSCQLAELYPLRRRRLTSQGPVIQLGTSLPLAVPAQQVLVLEATPARPTVDEPTIVGLPGTIVKIAGGYRIKTHGPQGHTVRFAVLLPEGSPAITVAEVNREYPVQPQRQWAATGLKLLARRGPGVLLEITFRRQSAPTELRSWVVRAETLDSGITKNYPRGFRAAGDRESRFPLFVDATAPGLTLPMTDAQAQQLGLGTLANFCGGYIENAFGEEQETWIDLKTGPAPDSLPEGGLTSGERFAEPRPLDPMAKSAGVDWWLQTRFELPFMYTIGAEPFFDEHTFLVLPMIRQASVRSVKAWINGQPLDVRAYRYPRNRGLATYYADLVGSGARGGQNTLVLHLGY